MEHDPPPPSRTRENMLAIALTIAAGAAIWFILDLVTMGMMSGLLMGGVILAVVFMVHYFAWGRSFSDEIAAERDKLRRQDEREALPKSKVPPGAIQDISVTQGIKKK